MSKTTSLIHSGLTALAIVTAATATAQVLLRQAAWAKDHSKDHKDHGDKHHH